MPDLGHDLLFGAFLPPVVEQADAIVDLAVRCEGMGLDLVTVQDHPYQPSFLDTWTLLSVIAARTSTIRVAPNVANLPLRPPAVLARSVASLDVLSHGRVELGLGAGAFWDAIEAMGGPRRSPGESVVALEEAIAVLRALWTPGRTPHIEGDHYHLTGAKSGPIPTHPVEIWVGSYKPRMLRLTGRLGDGWLPSAAYAPPQELPEMSRVVDDAALAAGRTPADVRRLYNVDGSFGRGGGFLDGTVDDWVEQLAGLALDEGFSAFILANDPSRVQDLQRFAGEVVPAVRETVRRERTAATPRERPVDVTPLTREEARPEGLGVVATPDDGTRLSARRPWEESTRPINPVPDRGTTYTAAGQQDAQHLIDVHDHLRGELAQVRDLVRQVAEGTIGVGRARSLISTMTLRQNNWTLGTYCESYCRLVATHHTIEDQAMFPRLRAALPTTRAVVDRLEQEHHVIAEVLEDVDSALVALVQDTGGMARVQEAVDLLTDTLVSHLSYEERELIEPLARLGGGMV